MTGHPRVFASFTLLYLLFFQYSASGQGNMQNTLPVQKPLDDIFQPLVHRGLVVQEFQATIGDKTVNAIIASPPKDELDPNPVLLLTIGGASTHFVPPNQQPAEYFWTRGHRVVSFSTATMPGSLETLRDMVLNGPDPFETFIEEARAVLKYCVDQGWAKPDRIVVTGISRFAYLAFRLMAADPTLNIGGGFAPVTDWRDLSEFAPAKDQAQIANLRLSLYADKLAGKKIYMAIGSHDERVSTWSCCQFFLDLNAANQKRGLDRTYVDLYVTPDPDHYCTDQWIERGMEILLNHATAGEKKAETQP